MEDEHEEEEVFPSFTTPKGSVIKLKVTNPYGFFSAYYEDGGDIPDVLKGSFTGLGPATTAIQNYIHNQRRARAGTGENKTPEPIKIKPEKDRAKGYRKKKETTEVGENISS